MALIISVENLQLQTKIEILVVRNRSYIKYDFELFHIAIGVAERQSKIVGNAGGIHRLYEFASEDQSVHHFRILKASQTKSFLFLVSLKISNPISIKNTQEIIFPFFVFHLVCLRISIMVSLFEGVVLHFYFQYHIYTRKHCI